MDIKHQKQENYQPWSAKGRKSTSAAILEWISIACVSSIEFGEAICDRWTVIEFSAKCIRSQRDTYIVMDAVAYRFHRSKAICLPTVQWWRWSNGRKKLRKKGANKMDWDGECLSPIQRKTLDASDSSFPQTNREKKRETELKERKSRK